MDMEHSRLPLISVIIPCFNLEEVIGRCIESILAQTYTNIEVLVIDDGSEDRSFSVISGYAARDKRVKALHQENQGVGAAYNRGLAAASGMYIYILDGDNYADRQMLSEMYGRAAECGCDAVLCGYYLESYAGGRYELTGHITYPSMLLSADDGLAENIFAMYRAYIWQSPCNKLYRAALLRDFFFDADRRHMMVVDSDFNLRLLDRICSAAVLSEPMVHYVRYPAAAGKQITSLWRQSYRREALECEMCLFDYFKAYFAGRKSTAGARAVNNYFAGRLLQIGQVLLLEKSLLPEQRQREKAYFRERLADFFAANKVDYAPYCFLGGLAAGRHWRFLKMIYSLLAAVKKRMPALIKLMKAG